MSHEIYSKLKGFHLFDSMFFMPPTPGEELRCLYLDPLMTHMNGDGRRYMFANGDGEGNGAQFGHGNGGSGSGESYIFDWTLTELTLDFAK